MLRLLAILYKLDTDELTIIRGSRTLAAPCCGAQFAFPIYPLQVPELSRELGQFSDTERAIERVPHEYDPVARKLIAGLISEKKTAPVRFRY